MIIVALYGKLRSLYRDRFVSRIGLWGHSIRRLFQISRPLYNESMFAGDRSEPNESSVFHEAAHAVAAVVLDIGFRHVSVIDDRNTLGRMVLEQRWPHLRPEFNPSAPLDRRVAEDWILLALAGEFASAYHSGLKPDLHSHGASADFEIAAAVAERLFAHPRDSDAFLNKMFIRAQVFISEPLRWRQISAVAVQLDRLRVLDQQQVGQIMADVATAGDITGTHWAVC